MKYNLCSAAYSLALVGTWCVATISNVNAQSCDVTVAGTVVDGRPTASDSEVANKITNGADTNGDGTVKVCLAPNLLITGTTSGSFGVYVRRNDYKRVWIYGDPAGKAEFMGPVGNQTGTMRNYLSVAPSSSSGSAPTTSLSNLKFTLTSNKDVGIHFFRAFSPLIDNISISGSAAEIRGLSLYSSWVQNIANITVDFRAAAGVQDTCANTFFHKYGVYLDDTQVNVVTGLTVTMDQTSPAIHLSRGGIGSLTTVAWQGGGNFLYSDLGSIGYFGDAQLTSFTTRQSSGGTHCGRAFQVFRSTLGTIDGVTLTSKYPEGYTPPGGGFLMPLTNISFGATELSIKSFAITNTFTDSRGQNQTISLSGGSRLHFASNFTTKTTKGNPARGFDSIVVDASSMKNRGVGDCDLPIKTQLR